MPGFPTHLYIQRQITDSALNAGGPLGNIAGKMRDNPQMAAMGSIGPDLTFFLDLMPVAQVWLERGIAAYDMVNEFVRPYTDAISSVGREVDRKASGAVPGYEPLRDAFVQFLDTFTIIKDTLLTQLATFASGYIDAFAYIKLPLQTGLREEGWFWFDMVHYRRTSQFARNLYLRAGNDEKLQAFAAGYATHLAADTAGHSYVNCCAGGPYRTQWQRHHCTDNYIDVWTLAHYLHLDVNESQWQKNYPDRMSAGVRGQILQALRDTYSGIRHPDGGLLDGREWPNDGDLERMYDMLIRAITMQTSGYSITAPKPPDFPIDFDSFPSLPDYDEGGGGGGGRRRREFSWSAFFESCWDFVKKTCGYVADVVKWVIDTLVATSLYPFQWALYLIQLSCYTIYRACRRILALRGYCFAHPDELDGGTPLSAAIIGTLPGASLVGTAALLFDTEKTFYMPDHRLDPQFPHPEALVNSPLLTQDATNALAGASPTAKVAIQHCLAVGGFPQAFQTPWLYPSNAGERERMPNGPYEDGSKPDAFIERAVFNREYYDALKQVGNSVRQMVGISNVASRSWRSCLGNAVDLGKAILTDTVTDGGAPDFNLDGDRGYGWLCWDVIPIGGKTRKTSNFTEKDVVIGDRVGAKA